MLLFPSTMALKFVSDFFSKSCNVLSNNPTGSSFFPCSSVCYYIILISFLADLCLGNICSHMGFFGFTKNICRRRSGHVLSHIRKRFSWWWKCSSKWKKLTLYWPVLECVGEKLLVKKQVSFTFLADLCLGHICSHMGFFGFTKDICRRRSGHVLSHIRKRFSWWWKCSLKWKKLNLYWPVLECVGEKLLVQKQVSWRTKAPVRFLTKDKRQGNWRDL